MFVCFVFPGRVSRALSGRWALHMSSALQFLHNKGVIVVDCTPHNFVVTKSMVLKLGHLAFSTKVMSSSFLVPCRYVAPEHISGTRTKATKASDMFTLGTSLLRLVTGEQPFAFIRETQRETVLKQRTIHRIHNPLISDFQYDSEVFKTIISECCEMDPSNRPCIDEVVTRIEADQNILRGTLLFQIGSGLALP